MEAFIWQRHAAACPHKARHWNLDLIQQPELLMLSRMTFQVGDPTSSNRRGVGTRNDSHAWLSDLVESRRRVFLGGGSHRLSTQHHLFFFASWKRWYSKTSRHSAKKKSGVASTTGPPTFPHAHKGKGTPGREREKNRERQRVREAKGKRNSRFGKLKGKRKVDWRNKSVTRRKNFVPQLTSC